MKIINEATSSKLTCFALDVIQKFEAFLREQKSFPNLSDTATAEISLLAPSSWSIRIGYWPSVRSIWLDIGQVFYLFLIQWYAKKNEANIHRISLVNKGFIIQLSWKFSLRDAEKITLSSILPARVANHSAGFHLCCPLAELAIQ